MKFGTVKKKNRIPKLISNVNLDFIFTTDPTAGASMNEVAKWVLDEISLKESVKKALAKFFGPMPVCVVDMNAVALTSAPAVSLKW